MLDLAPTTNVRILEGTIPDEKCLGTVCIPTRDHLNAATVTSLVHTDWTFIPTGKNIERSIIQGSILTLQRNEAVQRMKGDWLLFIDDDMTWQADAIGRLIASADALDADIMGALCFRRAAPYQPTMFMRETKEAGAYNFLEKWDTDIVEVDATGMAFVLIRKRVFEMLGGPMPALAKRRDGVPPDFFRWEGVLGEDLRFCQEAKAAGARIFVDTRIEIGHVSEVEIKHRHFLLEARDRPPGLVLARKRLNDKMGLPTLTKKDIDQRLKAL